MKVFCTPIEDLVELAPTVFEDSRGSFFESFNLKIFKSLVKNAPSFVQDNQSVSRGNVLRGLHIQIGNPQAKLVRVTSGSILDVAVDLRKNSRSFGKYYSVELSDVNNKQLFIPEGFAHGFLTLSDVATVNYKVSDYYNSKEELSINWDDPDLNINWRFDVEPVVSDKDRLGISFNEFLRVCDE